MLGCTVPFAMSNFGCASTCAFILEQDKAIKTFLDLTSVKAIERGFCQLGAQLEVEMWEDIIYHSQLSGEKHSRTRLARPCLCFCPKPCMIAAHLIYVGAGVKPDVDAWLFKSRPREPGTPLHPVVLLKKGREQKKSKSDMAAQVAEVNFDANAPKKAALTITEALRLVMQVHGVAH